MLINDDNAPDLENVPASSNQWEVVYNSDWGHDGFCQRCLEGARNHNLCVCLNPDIDPTEMQMFQMFFFRSFV